MTDFDPIGYYSHLKALQRNVEAISFLAYLMPEDDNITPLIRSLSDSLEGAMVPVMVNGIRLSGVSEAL